MAHTFLLTPEDTTPSDYTQRCQTLITASGNSLKLTADNFLYMGSVWALLVKYHITDLEIFTS